MSNGKHKLREGIFKSEGVDVVITEETIEQIEDVGGFLDKKVHDPKGILIGPKGAGKSLLLNSRAWINSSKLGTKTIPKKKRGLLYAFELTDTLNTSDLIAYIKQEDYEIVWKFGLHYFIIKRLRDDYDIKIPDYDTADGVLPLPGEELLSRVSGNIKNISDLGLIVSVSLKNRSVVKELEKDLGKLINIMSKLDGIIEDDYTFYIDNVDQAFLEKLRFDSIKEDSSSKGKKYKQIENSKVELWLNANIAFMLAIWNFNKKKYFISIFASLRIEAWNHYLMKTSNTNFPNVAGTLIDKYVNFQHSFVMKHMSKLMNSKRIHPKATNEELNQETFRALIIRHTFRNPRELVFLLPEIGKKLLSVISNDEEVDIEEFGFFVDKIANEIVFQKYFIKDCLPSFPMERLNAFLERIKKNYFVLSEVMGDEDFVETLYRFGLLGAVEEYQKGKYRQIFRRGTNYAEKKIALKESEIYLLHPCLDYQLGKIFGGFYYPHCIIGHFLDFNFKRELEFYLPPEEYIPSQNGNKDKIIEIYKTFYHSEYSVEAFSKLPGNINSSRVNLLFDKPASQNKGHFINQMQNIFFDLGDPKEILLLQASKMKSLHEDNRKLIGNIEFRILVALAVLFDILISANDVLQIFEGKIKGFKDSGQVFYLFLFSTNVFRPKSKNRIDKQKVFASLSTFEKKVICEFVNCDNLNEFINSLRHREHADTIRNKIQGLGEICSDFYQKN